MKPIVFAFFGLNTAIQAQTPVRSCHAEQLYLEEMNSNPSFKLQRESINQHLRSYQSKQGFRTNTITIPVVVHVVYHNDAQNISDEQIFNQIEALNRDFSQVFNTKYKQAAASTIRFVLASSDPQGYRTRGITRTYTDKIVFPTGASIMVKAAGGKDAWPSKQYLNIWVGNVSGVLGFAYMPGSKHDGVVIGHRYFGSINMTPPFDLGRTVTHEVGHWLNLLHTWGLNTGCEADDEVLDTPNSAEPNYGCRPEHISCSDTDMVENYMDYSDDQCMNLFTQGQIDRMHALFIPGGYRSSLLTSPGLLVGLPHPCENGIKDDTELAIDCGGICPPCDSTLFISCGDGKKNGQETGIDCGGSCSPCPTCNDGIQNGNESGVDCGGTCSPCPCISKGEFSMYDYIESIQINDSNVITGDNLGYASYPHTYFNLYTNKINNLKLLPGKIAERSQEFWSIWIDWNQDHVFDNKQELIYQNNAIGPLSDTISFASIIKFSLPALDTYQMRVQMQWGEYGAGCASFPFGEVEDYQVILKESNIDLCTNGLQDLGEQGIDCGPSCIPCTISYCSSSGTLSKYEFIQSVHIGTMDNVSGNNNGYIDFTALPISAKAGGQLSYKLEAGFGGNFVLYENWYVWADWNQDGDFKDESELILNQSGTQSLSGFWNIPHTIEGKIRLRIQMKDSKSSNACEVFGFGEVEDYILEVGTENSRKSSEQNSSIAVKTFPNPVTERLNIQCIGFSSEQINIMLISNLGQIVSNATYSINLNSGIQMDCSSIPSGVYSLVLSDGLRKESRKIVILH